jgi:preprotein translocase subunit SecE
VKLIQWIKKFPPFLRDVRLEVKKTSFPSRTEVVNTTLVVIVVVFIFGVYLYLVDTLVYAALSKVFELFQ